MQSDPSSRPDLSTLARLADALHADAATDAAVRRRRDRAIGRDLKIPSNAPGKQLVGWLAHPDSPAAKVEGHNAARLHHLACILLSVIGLFAGWGAAIAVFHYTGQQPVNVIHVLAVFVFAQLLLTALTLVTMLPGGLLRWLPGARAVQDLLALLSPGRLHQALMRRLPAAWRERLETARGSGRAHRATFGHVEKWAVSHTAQWGALCFQVAAIAGALYLVVFSDLAFSWNTTLQVEAGDLHRVTSALSAPWASVAPDAAPSQTLIEATRHYRLQDGTFPTLDEGQSADPSALGGWWPFLIACMVAYGFLPRVITLLVSTLRLRTSIRDAMIHLPGSRDLLDRLNGQLVETAADMPEPGATLVRAPTGTAPVAPPAWPTETAIQLVNWAQVELDEDAIPDWCAAALSAAPAGIHHVGGARTVQQDQETIAAIATGEPTQPVVILVRAWEPPVAEILDFLRDLRDAGPADRRIVLVPVGMSTDGRPGAPAEVETERWRRRLGTLGDPTLAVNIPGEPSA